MNILGSSPLGYTPSVSKRFGSPPVLDGLAWCIGPGQVVGLPTLHFILY